MMLALVLTRQGLRQALAPALTERRKYIVIFAPPWLSPQPCEVTPAVIESRASTFEDDSKWIYWMHTERAPTNAKRMLIKLSTRRPKRRG